MPVHFRRGLDFENRDFYRVSKIEDNFKCHFSACYGLFSLFTFEIKRNWLRVIGTLNRFNESDSPMSQGKLFERVNCAAVTKTIFHVVTSRKGNNKFSPSEHNLIHFASQI